MAPQHFDDIIARDSCSSAEFDKTNMVKTKQNAAQSLPPQKKKVSFNRLVFVRETLHIADYAFEEKRNTWFNKTEMQNIKAGMAATLRLIVSGNYQGDDDNHCSRGLEFRSRAGSRKRKENKLLALDAVLGEQDNQYNDGIINAKAISVVYQQVSLRPRIGAHERGVQDQIVADADRRLVTEVKPLRMLFGESAKRKTRSFRLLRQSSSRGNSCT